MAAVWMRFRAELRARWPALLAVALLVGLAGGAALTAFAGARRTDTAFGRLVKKTSAWDVLVNPDLGSDSKLDDHAIAAVPQVAQAGRVNGIFLGPAHPKSFTDFFEFGNVLASDGKVGYAFSRPKLIHGRMPDANRADEVLLNPLQAKRNGWHVGDRIELLALNFQDISFFDSGDYSFQQIVDLIKSGKVGTVAPATVTGIGTFPDEVVVDEGFEVGQMFLTPAFLKRYPETGIGYWGEIVRLRHGARDIPQFRREVQALVPGESIAFQTRPKTTTKVERAVRPSVGALTIFAAVIALTGLLVIGQALARQSFLDANDNDALRALGATRGQLFATSMLRAVVIALLGAVLAVVLAVLASPLTPIGVARTAEPDPGLDVAWRILGAGFAVTVVVVLLLALWPAWRNARPHAADASSVRPSRVVSVASEVGFSVPAAAGIRMALEPGRGRTAVPVRTTILGAGLAIATVVAAGVFASSLHHLVSTPRLFGWNWDTRMSINAQDSNGQVEPSQNAREEVASLLDSSPRVVEKWGTVSLSDITVDRNPMPAVGIDLKRGAALPTLVDGRLPRGPREIALGRLTKRQLGVGTGDVVTARDNDNKRVALKVVGTVVLPGLGTYPGADKTSLGEGAVVTRDQLYELGPDFGRDDFVVRFSNAATAPQRHSVLSRAQDIAQSVDPEGFGSEGVQRPSDIIAYDRVRSTPLVLALVLAVLASATVAHALVSAVRRRRRDLALLATLGLTRRQISSTVAWQSTTVGVLALVIGVPLGIIGGRWAWGLLADDLGTLSEPRVPVLAIAIGVPVVVLLCNAVAYVPGRIAARMKPAVVLRSE
jgi:ABC-type lipoprotein release transport system permease subunit